jgi:hypothetical protein
MKRNETILGQCTRDNFVLDISVEGERSSNRHNVRSTVSSEDTRRSESRVKEDEVISPWLL